MFVKVIQRYNDLKFGKELEAGVEFECSQERGEFLISQNLVKEIKQVELKIEAKEIAKEVISEEKVEEVIEKPKKSKKK